MPNPRIPAQDSIGADVDRNGFIEPDGAHFNIQIKVQEVQVTSTRAGITGAATKSRRVRDVLIMAVTASNEQEAYDKALRLLEVNRGMAVQTYTPPAPWEPPADANSPREQQS